MRAALSTAPSTAPSAPQAVSRRRPRRQAGHGQALPAGPAGALRRGGVLGGGGGRRGRRRVGAGLGAHRGPQCSFGAMRGPGCSPVSPQNLSAGRAARDPRARGIRTRRKQLGTTVPPMLGLTCGVWLQCACSPPVRARAHLLTHQHYSGGNVPQRSVVAVGASLLVASLALAGCGTRGGRRRRDRRFWFQREQGRQDRRHRAPVR